MRPRGHRIGGREFITLLGGRGVFGRQSAQFRANSAVDIDASRPHASRKSWSARPSLLREGSPCRRLPIDRQQAIAIALNEAGLSNKPPGGKRSARHRSTTGPQPRTDDVRPQRRTPRDGHPRSDSTRTPIPACMAPNNGWRDVCARSPLDRLLGVFVD